MQSCIVVILFLVSATIGLASQAAPQIHTLKSGEQFIVKSPIGQSEFERDTRPRNPLDQGGDDCYSAPVINTLPFCDQGTTSGYNNDFYEECAQTDNAPDVAYEYSPPNDLTISISLLGSSFDTQLTLYETDTDCDNFWYYDCSGDYSGPQSCIEGVSVYAGYIYYIVVDGEFGQSGSYVLNVIEGSNCPSTSCGDGGGEDCSDPLIVASLPYCDSRNTLNYADDYFPECNSLACGERDVVYEYVPTSEQFLGVSVTSTQFQPHVEIWESDTDCSSGFLLGCATINSGGNSCISGVDVYPGYNYYIYVDGHECGGDGQYTLNIYEGGGCVYDSCSTSGGNGETCETAITVNALPFTYSGTTLDMNNDYDFCEWQQGAPDVVFSYTPQNTHLANILTCGNTLFESNIYIFRDGDTFNPFGNCAPKSCYTFFGGFWQNAALYCFEFEVGHDYCIVVDGAWSNSNGPFELTIEETVLETCTIGELCPSLNTETEPNNSCNPPQFDPDTLMAGDTIAGSICEAGDRDYFIVVTPEDQWNVINVNAGDDCNIGGTDIGISIVYPEYCGETDPCNNCGWISGCGPETLAVVIRGLGDCFTGTYKTWVDSTEAPRDECDPVACDLAPLILCDVPTLVSTCDGCQSPICQTYRDGCSGSRGWTGPQKFFRLVVPANGSYTINVSAVDTTQDAQFSLFTDCDLPRTTCVFSQDQNYWAQNPTGPRWTETGTVALTSGTYYLHASIANGSCGDMNVLVTCNAAPCVRPDSLTIKWTTASTAELRFISDGGDYQIYSTNIPNNDGDPRGGDPQWSLRATQTFTAGQALWTDASVADVYRNYVVVKVCP